MLDSALCTEHTVDWGKCGFVQEPEIIRGIRYGQVHPFLLHQTVSLNIWHENIMTGLLCIEGLHNSSIDQ